MNNQKSTNPRNSDTCADDASPQLETSAGATELNDAPDIGMVREMFSQACMSRLSGLLPKWYGNSEKHPKQLMYRLAKIAMQLNSTALQPGLTMNTFDFSRLYPKSRRRAKSLVATDSFKKNIDSKSALIILGKPGVGKTHLAHALGVKAIEMGYSVRVRKSASSAVPLISPKTMNVAHPDIYRARQDVLIIDDAAPGNRAVRSLIINSSYTSSVIVCSDSSVREWAEVVGCNHNFQKYLVLRNRDTSKAAQYGGSGHD